MVSSMQTTEQLMVDGSRPVARNFVPRRTTCILGGGGEIKVIEQ